MQKVRALFYMTKNNTLKYERYKENKTNATIRTIEYARDGEVKISQSSNTFGLGKKANRIYVTKFKYYLDKELDEYQLRKLSAWLELVKDNRVEGKKYPRFTDLLHTDDNKKHRAKKKTKDNHDYDNLAKRLNKIIKNNFWGAWDEYLITLTNGRKASVKTMDRDITAFANRLKRALDGKEYKFVMVKEYSENGYHLHVLFKCKSYQRLHSVHDLFSEAWKIGYVGASRLKDPRNITEYFFGNEITRTWDEKDVDEAFMQSTKDVYASSREKIHSDTGASKEDYKLAKEDYKRTKRSEVKSDDKLMYTSGKIDKPLRFKTDDNALFEILLQYFKYSYKVDVIDDCERLLNRTIVDVCQVPRDRMRQVYDYVFNVCFGGRVNG